MNNSHSLKWSIVLWTGLLTSLVLSLLIFITSTNFEQQLKESIHHDLSMQNKGYSHAIYSTIQGKIDIILALRNDLELYDTVGQMWVHLAYHSGEKIFDQVKNLRGHKLSFEKKLSTYLDSDQLSSDRRTPRIEKMLKQIGTRQNAFGDGMKFFYIGIKSPNQNKQLQSYNQYQDSSLWVPNKAVDGIEYNPFIRPWYIAGQSAKRNEVIFTEPYGEKRTKEAVTAGSTQININGKKGTLAAAISIKPIVEELLKIKSDHGNAEISILSKGYAGSVVQEKTQPRYIYSSRNNNLGDTFKTYNDPEIIKKASNRDIMKLYDATTGQDSGVIEWVINGKERLVAFDTIPVIDWKIFSSVSKEKLMYPAINTRNNNIVLSALGLIVLLVIIFIVVKRALNPVDTMKMELNELAKSGNYSKEISVKENSEIGDIAKAINLLLDKIAKKDAKNQKNS